MRRPPVWRALLALALGAALVSALIGALGAALGRVPGPMLFLLPLGAAWALVRVFRVLRLALRGWSSYALTDEELLFVGELGDTVGTIPLASVQAIRWTPEGFPSIRFTPRVVSTAAPRAPAPGQLIGLGGAHQIEGLEFRNFHRGSLRQWFIAPGSGVALYHELVRRVRAVNPAVEVDPLPAQGALTAARAANGREGDPGAQV